MPETVINTEIKTLPHPQLEEISCDVAKAPNEISTSKETPPTPATKPLHETSTSEQTPSTPAKEPLNYNLSKFNLQKILNNNTKNKSIVLLGKFPDLSNTDNAIVIFEKQAFQETDVATPTAKSGIEENVVEEPQNAPKKQSYFCDDLKVKTEFVNNIYGSYRCTPPLELNGFKATVVYPATDKHIEKYSICQKYIINETPELYEDVTLPYITSSKLSLEWVYNILEHKQETERIVYEDSDPENGFVLLPDLKWDGRNSENLYLLVITHKRDIKSLRDLNATHLPMLRSIRARVVEVIEKRYGIVDTQLRMYFHYQPTFYHLHLHINLIKNDAPGIWCEKSHILDTVINNLELLPNYYQKATLPFVLYEGNELLKLYESKIQVRKAAKRAAELCDADAADVVAKKPKLAADETSVGAVQS